MNKKRNITIGIIGTEKQVNHCIPVLEQEYNVVNLQAIWSASKNKIVRIIDLLRNIKKIDVLYNIYTTPFFWKKANLAHYLGKKVITHWIGSDTLDIVNGKTDLSKLEHVDYHLTCFDELSHELEKYNITSSVIPIIPFNYDFSVSKMPINHAVMIYMPKGKEIFYGFNIIKILFESFPGIPFNIVGNDDSHMFIKYSNVKVLGILNKNEMEQLYDNISIVIRMPQHDGLSMSVLEGIAKGKNVIWNHKYNYCKYAQNEKDLVNIFSNIINDDPVVNIEGHNYIVNEFSKEKFLCDFNSVLSNINIVK